MSFWDEVSCLTATLLTPASPITSLPDLCTVHTNPLTPLDLHSSPAFVLGRLLTYCTKNSSGEENLHLTNHRIMLGDQWPHSIRHTTRAIDPAMTPCQVMVSVKFGMQASRNNIRNQSPDSRNGCIQQILSWR